MTFLAIILLLGFAFYYFMKRSPKPGEPQKQAQEQDDAAPKSPKGGGSYGKWIGGGLGWAFGGPLGALLGFAVGSMFDGGSRQQSGSAATQEGDFSLSLLALSAAVMRADGSIKKSELAYVKQFFRQNFSADKTQQLMLVLRDVLKKEIPLREISQQIGQQMAYHDKLQLLHYLFGIAQADGHIHASEASTIEQIAHYLAIQRQDYQSIRAMFVKDSESIYKILEIDPQASNEEVKKAYKKMAVKYHPDKVSHLGEEIRQAAEDKFQQLQAAYEEIKKQRGML